MFKIFSTYICWINKKCSIWRLTVRYDHKVVVRRQMVNPQERIRVPFGQVPGWVLESLWRCWGRGICPVFSRIRTSDRPDSSLVTISNKFLFPWGSSVITVTRLQDGQPRSRLSITDGDQAFISFEKRPYQVWSPPSLIFNLYRG